MTAGCILVLVVIAILFLEEIMADQPQKIDYKKFGAPSKWEGKFPRGARPTPAHRLLAAPRFFPRQAPLAQSAMVPPQNGMFGNDRYGDCVTAESCFALAAYTFFCTGKEVLVPDSVAVQWASDHGVLEGADLGQVIQMMERDGITVNGVIYKDGADVVVDYSNESGLQSAIDQGPISIAVDANALPSGAGNQNGWVATGGSPGDFPNTDHNVDICGHGSAGWLFQQIGVPLPAGLNAATLGYLVDTWKTIGFVDYAWLRSTMVEAHLRTPTTVGFSPTPQPTPTPTPTPVPVPPMPTPALGDWLILDPSGTSVIYRVRPPSGGVTLGSGFGPPR